MRIYVLRRYHQRRKEAIKFLGGKCQICGSIKNLELDHINPKTKSFNIAKLWSISTERFWKEVKKCQLLCRPHHSEKTLIDLGQISAKGTHGTLSSRRYCNCRKCKDALNEWARKKYGFGLRKVAGHGSISMYGYHRCRCEKCRQFNTERARIRRAKIKGLELAGTATSF